mgnify:CR=1 FL=1
MLYHAFDMQKALLAGAGRWADASARILGSKALPFAYFGGVPQLVVPDNLRSGVTKACRYEPELNRTYADLARCQGSPNSPQVWSSKIPHPVRLLLRLLRLAPIPL